MVAAKTGSSRRWTSSSEGEVREHDGGRVTKRTPSLALYVILAYGITWTIWLPYVAAARSGSAGPGPFLYYMAAAGPFIGALVAEGYERGWRGVWDLLGRLVRPGTGGRWAAVGLLTPLALVPPAVIAVALFGGGWPGWDAIGITGRAPGLGPATTWILMVLSYGVGEEVGWRGFLLPRLQARRSALAATLLLTPVWAAWHLPAFLFREGYVDLGLGGTVGFLLSLAAGAVVLTVVYNASGGSVMAVALWHGTWNWLATSDGFQGPWVATMSALIMVGAGVLVWWMGPRDLAPGRRPAVPPGRKTGSSPAPGPSAGS